MHGALVPPMGWTQEYLHSPDSVLMGLASQPYDPADYIRDYNEFLGIIKGWKVTP